MLPSPPRPFRAPESHLSPPQSTFDPQLPALEKLPAPKFIRATPAEHSSPLRAVEPKTEDSDDELNLVGGPTDVTDVIGEGSSPVKDEQNAEDDSNPDILADQSIAIAISQRIAEGGEELSRPATSPRSHHGVSSRIFQLFYTAVMLLICGVALNYKMESAPIGYCDRGSRTNNYLEELRGRRSAVESCNRENRTLLYLPRLSARSESDGADLTPCPLPPLLPLPHPDSCAPCPNHAICSQDSVVCDVGYILRAHPLLSFLPASASARNVNLSLSSPPVDLLWKVLSVGLDGLPGFGSIALPPRCVEDPKRKRNIGALGKAIESVLGQERGRRLCTGGKMMDEIVMDIDGGDAKKWGVELENLRDKMKKKTPVSLELVISFLLEIF
jgi:Man1-Src1p-C-terminal domain